ncbi:hypothetical protein ZHAS_00008589 [Anopheles sinensis]|uniref:Uncharacterized protein n=1 Tax=Anopheles sinensis TaxID=74873 RepID=A0A084VT34_ANOSI|nr:hypothetical protein ZHAS_00008589 [Anopheles sinensis]
MLLRCSTLWFALRSSVRFADTDTFHGLDDRGRASGSWGTVSDVILAAPMPPAAALDN